MHFGVKNKKKWLKIQIAKNDPTQRGYLHPWRGSGGFWGVPPIRRSDILPWRGSGGFGGLPPFEEATSTPGAGVGGSAATLIEVRLGWIG